MGSLRFLLALSVAYWHLGPFFSLPLVPGDTAVQCFFVVSGFYMSLVLNGKYADAGYWIFVSNRWLRLFPIYFAVLVATLLLTKQQWPPLETLGSLYFAVSQATIFGLDGSVFLAVKNGALTLADGFNSSTLFAFSPIPQAWTLGLELWFYLIAPFILRRPVKVLIAVFLASLAVRMALQFGFDLRGDPWSYRFFPSELAFFMLGALAGRVDRKTLVVLALAAAAAVFVSRTGGIGRMASLSFLVAATVAIPRLFAATKNIEADRILGELSYPIYLVHVLVGIFIVGPSALLITVIVAAGLYFFIDRPVDRWRQARVISHTPSAMLLNAINKVDA